jgi:hypothetical protein
MSGNVALGNQTVGQKSHILKFEPHKGYDSVPYLYKAGRDIDTTLAVKFDLACYFQQASLKRRRDQRNLKKEGNCLNGFAKNQVDVLLESTNLGMGS